jgi:sulfur carrier protein
MDDACYTAPPFIDNRANGLIGSAEVTDGRSNMTIQVNGERRTAAAGTTIAGLLSELAIRTERVAVEVNQSILDKSEFGGRLLQDGDRVEIISFIGGGSEGTREHGIE